MAYWESPKQPLRMTSRRRKYPGSVKAIFKINPKQQTLILLKHAAKLNIYIFKLNCEIEEVIRAVVCV